MTKDTHPVIGIFRHAQAESEGDELLRPLTPYGIQCAKSQAKTLNMHWPHVICSPAKRTLQTATILSGKTPVELDLLYINGQPSDQVLDEIVLKIKEITSDESVLIVTHQPLMTPLIYKISKQHLDNTSLKAGEGVVIAYDTSLTVYPLHI